MSALSLLRDLPKNYPATLLNGGKFILGYQTFPLPDSIKQMSKDFQERYVKILGSAAISPMYRNLDDGQLKTEILANVREIGKTIPLEKIHYVFKTINYCGKLILVVVYITALAKLTKACL